MNKKSLILVTGGAGYVGAVLVEKLVQKGFKVRVFDALYFGEKPLEKVRDKIELIKGDIRNIPTSVFSGVISIIHLAGLSNDPTAEFNPVANFAINTKATIDLAKQAKKHDVKRFIFGSSASIYDSGMENGNEIKNESSKVTPKAAYALSKRKAEKAILRLADKNFTVTILRKGTIFGYSPRMRYDLVINAMVKNALQHNEIKIYNKGLQWRPLISLEDVVDVYIKLLSTTQKVINKQIFNLSLDNFLVIDIAVLIKNILEKNFKKHITIIYDEGDKNDRSYSIGAMKIEKTLHIKPKITIEKAVVDLVEKIHSENKSNFDNPIYYNILHMKPILEK